MTIRKQRTKKWQSVWPEYSCPAPKIHDNNISEPDTYWTLRCLRNSLADNFEDWKKAEHL